MLDKLEPHKQMLSDLAETGCEIELIVAMYVESDTSEAFSPSLCSACLNLGGARSMLTSIASVHWRELQFVTM
jgi:hypothetical protein